MHINRSSLVLLGLFVGSLQYCMSDVGRWICAGERLYVRTVFDPVDFWYAAEVVNLLEKYSSQVQSGTTERLDICQIEQVVASMANLFLGRQQVPQSSVSGSYFENSGPEYPATVLSYLKQYASQQKKECEVRLDIRPLEMVIITQAMLSVPQNNRDHLAYRPTAQPAIDPIESSYY